MNVAVGNFRMKTAELSNQFMDLNASFFDTDFIQILVMLYILFVSFHIIKFIYNYALPKLFNTFIYIYISVWELILFAKKCKMCKQKWFV